MKVNKKITAMLLSAVIAAAPAAAPIMDVQTVAAATTTTKTLKNAWSKNHKYYYDKNIKTKPLINGIGYKELYNYFDGLCSKEEVVEKIKQNSRHYAKRQYTFLNHQLNVVWFETDYNNFNNTIEKVSSYIKNN